MPRRVFFDLWSRFYDAPPAQWAIYQPVHHTVLGELRSRPAQRLLDVGCGTGALTARIGPVVDEMRSRIEAVGFRVCRQRSVPRLFGVTLPTVVTVAARTG